ncbi:hypothetical protein BKA62DRAFT_130704 [Auriculariales sp. MPI-PUGE-AT-0066]|nr:hypothetical protein BKA62DRAFT_130704 [Auriculariales sp. MPI-PUGE-AT-0066]
MSALALGWLAALPTELLLTIFSFAVQPPIHLDSDDFDELHYPPALLIAFYTHAQAARIRLACVSQEISNIVLPGLYTFVWIHRRGQVRRLAMTLQLHPERAALIKRFDVDTSIGGTRTDAMQASGLDVREIVDAIADSRATHGTLDTIVDRRATYVNVGDPRVQCPALLTRQVEAAGAALRRAYLTAYNDPSHGSWLANLQPLSNASGLQILELDLKLLLPYRAPAPAVATDYFTSGGLYPQLDAVHTLAITLPPNQLASEAALELIARCSIPMLSTLRLFGGVPSMPTPGLLAFLSAHGGNISTLELAAPQTPPSVLTGALANAQVVARAAAEAATLLQTLPSVEYLICGVSRVHALPHPLFTFGHPTVQAIGFKNLETKLRAQHSATVLDHMRDLLPRAGSGRWPQLREMKMLTYTEATMRRLSRSDSEARIVQLFWKRLIGLAEAEGVQILDIWDRRLPARVGHSDRGWNLDGYGVQL